VNSFREVAAGVLEWSSEGQTLRVEPWGPDAFRVRVAIGPVQDGLPGALDLTPGPHEARVKIEDATASVSNGAITAELGPGGEHGEAVLVFRTGDGTELLAEDPIHFWWPGPRSFTPAGNGYYRLEQKFRAYPGEKLFGLGQHTHGLLDQKGAVIDLVQRNAEVTIPFLVSSRGYGLLWNNPGVGRVELGANGTRWVADSSRQIDYWITAGAPAALLSRYADVTGHAPELPEWAAGFWQSKLRYRTQDELMDVAREYKRRGLPLSVMVVDYFHWTHLGDWKFDLTEWPDPGAMVRELADMGVKLMVSVWPSVSPLSENYEQMRDRGLLIGSEQGPLAQAVWPDKGASAPLNVAFYDSTNPEAREFVWAKVRDNYLRRYGIDVFWLDACEPEVRPGFYDNLRFHAGPGAAVANMYPRENAASFWEGLRSEAVQSVTFNRSAWAGSQRYGAVLWSGDIRPTWESLRAQIRAGLNVAMSGIPWWTTDIGGFHGGDPDSPEYRELMVRWFQYGAFCPLFRLHGNREPNMPFGLDQTGGPNEVWSYGPQAYEIIRDVLFLRERTRPYLLSLMRDAAKSGVPPMRPLFVDFPADSAAWEVPDEFMFGPSLLVAPVTRYKDRSRAVYLPSGASWRDAWTGASYQGGTTVTADAPLSRIPVFLRDDASLPIRG
jgi:alpha-D-xyloside xylohydrolase